MKHYDIIFFDVDDTLFDFTRSQQVAFKKVFAKYKLLNSLNLYEKSYQKISKVLWRDLEDGKINLVELSSERFRRLFLEHDIEMDAIVFNQDYLGFLAEQTHLIKKDRKSTRLNSSHVAISYAVFCLKKTKIQSRQQEVYRLLL